MITQSNRPVYSVVIPVYNAGEPILELVQRLRAVFLDVIKESFEIILVDDGSPDRASQKILRDTVQFSEVTLILLTRNFGKAGAIMSGLTKSSGKWVITIDDDLQQNPEDIPELLAYENHDVVSATYEYKCHTLMQRITSKIKHHFDSFILGYDVKISPLKLIKRHVVDAMVSSRSSRPYIPALLRDATNDIVSVPLTHTASVYGRSRFGLRLRFKQFSNLIIGNSSFLMQVVGWIGLIIVFASVIFAFSIIIRKVNGIQAVPGWSSVMVAILLVGGMNLAVASLIGQYLIRILDVSSNKPAYIVREIISLSDDS